MPRLGGSGLLRAGALWSPGGSSCPGEPVGGYSVEFAMLSGPPFPGPGLKRASALVLMVVVTIMTVMKVMMMLIVIVMLLLVGPR